MGRIVFALVLVLTTVSCGVIKDPDPTDLDDAIRLRAGASKTLELVLDGDDFDDWDEYEDTAYLYWDEHVRDLPPGFDHDTIDVDDSFDGLYVTYRVSVEPWVEPGEYDFEVRYEFWPDDDVFREEFRVLIQVTVKPPREEDAGGD